MGVVCAAGLCLLAAPALAADAWFSGRIPVGVHLGSPSLGIESGARADLLVMPSESAMELTNGRGYRKAVGLLLEARTLNVSDIGLGAGLEGAVFTQEEMPLGVVVEGGVSRWLISSREGTLSVHASLSLQLRGTRGASGLSWPSISGLYVRAGTSIQGGAKELTAGLDLGSAILGALGVVLFGNHD